MSASHRFNTALRYRGDDHEAQRQLTPGYVLDPVREALGGIVLDPCTEGDDGLMHTPETRPFTREHIEKKWGPLRPTDRDPLYRLR